MLQLKNIKLLPEGKIIKAEEYAALLKGQDIIEAAEKEAQQIVEEAKKAFQEEKKRGYQLGLEEGKVKISEQMLDTVSNTINYYEKNQEDIVDIIIQTIKRILGEFEEGELVTRLVKNALEVAKNQEHVTLVVHPKSEAFLRERMEEIMKAYPSIEFIDIVTDNRQKEGGCLLKTEIGVVDASLDVQLESIRNSLKKAFE